MDGSKQKPHQIKKHLKTFMLSEAAPPTYIPNDNFYSDKHYFIEILKMKEKS